MSSKSYRCDLCKGYDSDDEKAYLYGDKSNLKAARDDGPQAARSANLLQDDDDENTDNEYFDDDEYDEQLKNEKRSPSPTLDGDDKEESGDDDDNDGNDDDDWWEDESEDDDQDPKLAECRRDGNRRNECNNHGNDKNRHHHKHRHDECDDKNDDCDKRRRDGDHDKHDKKHHDRKDHHHHDKDHKNRHSDDDDRNDKRDRRSDDNDNDKNDKKHHDKKDKHYNHDKDHKNRHSDDDDRNDKRDRRSDDSDNDGGKHKKSRMRRTYIRMPTGKKFFITVPVQKKDQKPCKDETRLITLNPKGRMGRREYTIVTKEIEKTMLSRRSGKHHGGVTGFEFVKVQKVVNCCLWRRYLHVRQQIFKELGYVNEKMLFFSSKYGEDVVTSGVHVGEHFREGVFGKGLYFAKHSTVANKYVFSDRGNDTCKKHKRYECTSCKRRMVLCRVSLGKEHEQNKPKDYDSSLPEYDSVVGVPSRSLRYQEHVLWDGAQVYPEYIITYRIM